MQSPSNSSSSKRRAKFVLGGAAVAAAVLGLVAWAMARPGSTAFYRTVTEVSRAGADGEQVRVFGNVVPDSLERSGVQTRFSITDEGARLQVETSEALPDAFDTAYRNDPSSVEIVAQGRYDGETFAATQVLAKCPSKFKAKT
jgi:cytochrome c-type biogenesis protein CcmE